MANLREGKGRYEAKLVFVGLWLALVLAQQAVRQRGRDRETDRKMK